MRVLLIETDESVTSALRNALDTEGYSTVLSFRGDEGLALAKAEAFDIVITALKLPGLSGLEVVRQLHSAKRKLPVIVLTGFGTTDSAIEAIRNGAFDYLTKPFDMPALLDIVAKAAARNEPDSQQVHFPKSLQSKSCIVGSSQAMHQVYKQIGRAARSNQSVLICGETGTGKELVARAIHDFGGRAEQPFIAVNCSAIPETLLESELFGHERGAFTDADSRRIGYFEQAKHGTLFLDEIGDLPLSAQVKLLRAIQEKYVRRVGGNEKIPIHARILSATHQDLDKARKEKRFREDLFYRLSAITICLPALKERPEDIPEIVSFFVHRLCADSDLEIPSIHAEAMEFLQAKTWKGNVRELENVVGYALLLAGNHSIRLSDVREAYAATREPTISSNRTIDDYLMELFLMAQHGEIKDVRARIMEDLDQKMFTLAIQAAHGNQAQAARWLGVTRRTMREKLARLGGETDKGESQ